MNLLEKTDWMVDALEGKMNLRTEKDFLPDENAYLISFEGAELKSPGISLDEARTILERLRLSKLRGGLVVKTFSIWPSIGKNRDHLIEVYAKMEKLTPTPMGNRLFTKDSHGKFYFDSKPIKGGRDGIYFKIFVVLFEHGDAEGFVSYKDINKYLEETGEKILTDQKEIMVRINNGLKNFWHLTKLKNKGPGGRVLIERKRGQGLILNNPTRS